MSWYSKLIELTWRQSKVCTSFAKSCSAVRASDWPGWPWSAPKSLIRSWECIFSWGGTESLRNTMSLWKLTRWFFERSFLILNVASAWMERWKVTLRGVFADIFWIRCLKMIFICAFCYLGSLLELAQQLEENPTLISWNFECRKRVRNELAEEVKLEEVGRKVNCRSRNRTLSWTSYCLILFSTFKLTESDCDEVVWEERASPIPYCDLVAACPTTKSQELALHAGISAKRDDDEDCE